MLVMSLYIYPRSTQNFSHKYYLLKGGLPTFFSFHPSCDASYVHPQDLRGREDVAVQSRHSALGISLAPRRSLRGRRHDLGGQEIAESHRGAGQGAGVEATKIWGMGGSHGKPAKRWVKMVREKTNKMVRWENFGKIY